MSNSAITGPTLIDFPAGMVMPYAGSTTPAGWLECNGSEVDISAYPALAAALGSTWNTAKNPLTGANYAAPAAGKFRVPDMRGAFLRGSSGGANNAQGVATALAEFQAQKTKKNGLSATASAETTSVSGNKNQMNTNSAAPTVPSGYKVVEADVITANKANSWINANGFYGMDSSMKAAGDHYHALSYTGTFSASGTTPAGTITVADGDAETRPDAVGVRYLIKF